MFSLPSRVSAVLLMVILAGAVACDAGDRAGATVPNPAVDATLATTKADRTAVVAGGCFWGIQAVFQHVKGVISATSGYSGGAAGTAEYELVSNGDTGHAESVKVTYDPSQITYGQLLRLSSRSRTIPRSWTVRDPTPATSIVLPFFMAPTNRSESPRPTSHN